MIGKEGVNKYIMGLRGVNSFRPGCKNGSVNVEATRPLTMREDSQPEEEVQVGDK